MNPPAFPSSRVDIARDELVAPPPLGTIVIGEEETGVVWPPLLEVVDATELGDE